MKVKYVDYATGKQYKSGKLALLQIPGLNRQFINKMEALLHLADFEDFVLRIRKENEIPLTGYSYEKTIDTMTDEENKLWLNIQAMASNEYEVTRWGEHYSAIATIIIGNYIPLHEYSGKAIFLEEVKLANVNQSATFPAIVFNPNRVVTQNDLINFIKVEWPNIKKIIKTRDSKDFKPDHISLEIWDLVQNKKMKYSDIASFINDKYKLKGKKVLGEENIKKIVADMKKRYNYFFENPYF